MGSVWDGEYVRSERWGVYARSERWGTGVYQVEGMRQGPADMRSV